MNAMGRCETKVLRQNVFGFEWEMKQPNSQNENPNNGLQATTHKVFAMRTLPLASHLSSTACGSCLNPDVGSENNGLLRVQRTLHH